jgi:PAS domain-containing protein
MNENQQRNPPNAKGAEARLRLSDERLRSAEAAGGVGTFELDLATDRWEWAAQVAVLFGFDPRSSKLSFADLERTIFIDDLPKVRAAIDTAKRTGTFYVEFRVKHHDDTSIGWRERVNLRRMKRTLRDGCAEPTTR